MGMGLDSSHLLLAFLLLGLQFWAITSISFISTLPRRRSEFYTALPENIKLWWISKPRIHPE